MEKISPEAKRKSNAMTKTDMDWKKIDSMRRRKI